jgi:hypothetical protein
MNKLGGGHYVEGKKLVMHEGATLCKGRHYMGSMDIGKSVQKQQQKLFRVP